MAFFGYSELLTLCASGKEGRGQPGKILIKFSGGIRGNELNGYPAYIPRPKKDQRISPEDHQQHEGKCFGKSYFHCCLLMMMAPVRQCRLPSEHFLMNVSNREM